VLRFQRECTPCLRASSHDGVFLQRPRLHGPCRNALCPRLICGRQTNGRHLGPLGAGANAASTSLIEKWAAQEMVEVQIDRLTNLGNKLLVTLAAEAQAKEKLSNGVDRWSADVR